MRNVPLSAHIVMDGRAQHEDAVIDALAPETASEHYVTPSPAHGDAAALPGNALDDAWARLSARARMVLVLAVKGMSMKEVGRTLGISPRTAESHKYNAMLTLGLRNRAALVEFALRQRLLGAPGTLATDAAAEPDVDVAASDRDTLPRPPLHAPELPAGLRFSGIPLPAIGGHAVAADPSAPAFLVGTSAAMQELFEHIARFAACDEPVLITGENGTGKRTAARAIHDRSARAAGPFVAVSCATYDGSPAGTTAADAAHSTRQARHGPRAVQR